jgi:hypothetical protein
MTFDFEAALAQAKRDAESTALEAIILGSSGAGKSVLAGTSGLKTLYLYSSGENHGVKAARLFGKADVIPVCFDHLSTSPDEALANLLSILHNKEQIAKLGVKFVFLDGATEVEALIRSSKAWKDACKTAKGAHNTYEEGRATVAAFRPIITGLKDLQRATGTHFAMSCILDVKELGASGEIVESSPRIQGFAVAESLVQQFGDVLVVGRMSKNGQVKHKLQFMTEIVKTAKDEGGVIKRTMNYSPRLQGVMPPPYMDADLSKVIELKRGTNDR